jgi:hypothetical protein
MPIFGMPIPPLDAFGLLPAGIHHCTVAEIETRFSSSDSASRRAILFAGFRDYLNLVRGTGCFSIAYVDGSFVTSNAAPKDVDLIIDLPNADQNVWTPLITHKVFDRPLMSSTYHVDPLARLEGSFGGNILEHFQSLRLSVAKSVGLSHNHKKGILRINI